MENLVSHTANTSLVGKPKLFPFTFFNFFASKSIPSSPFAPSLYTSLPSSPSVPPSSTPFLPPPLFPLLQLPSSLPSLPPSTTLFLPPPLSHSLQLPSFLPSVATLYNSLPSSPSVPSLYNSLSSSPSVLPLYNSLPSSLSTTPFLPPPLSPLYSTTPPLPSPLPSPPSNVCQKFANRLWKNHFLWGAYYRPSILYTWLFRKRFVPVHFFPSLIMSYEIVSSWY